MVLFEDKADKERLRKLDKGYREGKKEARIKEMAVKLNKAVTALIELSQRISRIVGIVNHVPFISKQRFK